MRSLLGAIVNRAPVPLARRRVTDPVNLFTGRGQDERLLASYGESGMLFAVVNRIAVAVSATEWKLWRKTKSGKAEDRTEVTSHAALDLWNKPNSFMPRQEFVETIQQHLDLVGEADLLVSTLGTGRGGAIPVELWPVRPDRITPVPDPFEFLAGYVYTSPDGERLPLSLAECLQLKMPNPLDAYRGLGPVQAILTDVDSARYSSEWNRAFFENSAEPGAVIEFEENLSDDEFDEFRDRWEQTHKGVNKAHRIAMLEKAHYVPLNFSQKDMQFVELANLTDDKILRAFGFPRAMVGMTDGVNFAAAKVAEYLMAKYITTPRLDRLKGMLNFELLPKFGDEALEFDYESPIKDDSTEENEALTARANAVVALSGVGFDPVDAMKAFELPEIKWTKPEPILPVGAMGPDGKPLAPKPGQEPGAPPKPGAPAKPGEPKPKKQVPPSEPKTDA